MCRQFVCLLGRRHRIVLHRRDFGHAPDGVRQKKREASDLTPGGPPLLDWTGQLHDPSPSHSGQDPQLQGRGAEFPTLPPEHAPDRGLRQITSRSKQQRVIGLRPAGLIPRPVELSPLRGLVGIRMMGVPGDDELDRLDRLDQPLALLDSPHANLPAHGAIETSLRRGQLPRKRNAQRLAARGQPADVEIPERRQSVPDPHGFDQRRSVPHQVTGAATRLSLQLL